MSLQISPSRWNVPEAYRGYNVADCGDSRAPDGEGNVAKDRGSRMKLKPGRLHHAVNLSQLAQSVLSLAQQKAFNQGLSDFENSTRDHPPYGFSDLQQAWRLGWLSGKQKKEGLNGG
jgi:hypothetical protein